MFAHACPSPLQPHAGRVSACGLTSSVKRSVLSMSMRFNYDARICGTTVSNRSAAKRTSGRIAPTPNSVQEHPRTRNIPHHA